MDTAPAEITALLARWSDGDSEALDRLVPIVYEELRRLARMHLRHERPDHTLSTTDLVHEAFLNLAGPAPGTMNDRIHFFAIASRVMRRVLIWYARRRSAGKRGAGGMRIPLEEEMLVSDARLEEMITLDDALSQLERLDERLCRVVECRYFGGLDIEETAAALGISPATVKRDWQTARAWLRVRLDEKPT